MALRMLPEPERHVERREAKLIDLTAFRHTLKNPAVAIIVALQMLVVYCFANFEGTLALLTKDRWDLGIRGNGLLFTYVGFCLLVSQGFVVRRFMPRVGEMNFATFGCLLLGGGLAGIALGGEPLSMLAVTVLGFSMITPSLASLLSFNTPEAMQGEVLGIGQSVQGLARILGPFVGNLLFAMNPELPYWSASGLML